MPGVVDAPRVVLLDGAIGTALHERGLPRGTLPEQWLLDRPDEITAVHAGYVAAGAQAVLTCTLNAHPPSLRSAHLETFTSEIRRIAVSCARASGARMVYGVIGPLEPSTEGELVRAFAEAAACDFERDGADALVVETITHLDEGVARVRGAAASGLEIVATVVPGKPAGASGERAVRELRRAGASIFGVNCAPPDACGPLMAAMKAAGATRLWAKPSTGHDGEKLSPQQFADGALRLVRAGVGLIGGCCGAHAAHVHSLAQGLQSNGFEIDDGGPDRSAGSSQERQRG